MNYLVTRHRAEALGNAHPNIVPYQTFATADGHVILAVGNDAQFARFCAVLGAPDVAERPALRDERRAVSRTATR